MLSDLEVLEPDGHTQTMGPAFRVASRAKVLGMLGVLDEFSSIDYPCVSNVCSIVIEKVGDILNT